MLQYEYVTARVKVLLAKFEIVKTYQPLWYRYIVYHEAVCVWNILRFKTEDKNRLLIDSEITLILRLQRSGYFATLVSVLPIYVL